MEKTSKLLSLVLRHKPETIGLSLDAEGWAVVPELLDRLAAHGHPLTRSELETLVANNDKKRFLINGDRIRASQGHSIEINLGLAPSTPPETLYHGTARRFLDAILSEGLTRQSRQHVHLSSDVETATKVGRRHGRPVVLTVNASAMLRHGCVFFQSENGVWLTDAVPPQYLAELSPQSNETSKE